MEVTLTNRREEGAPIVPLHNAARDDQEDTVNRWIEYYRSKNTLHLLNKFDRFGYTPVHYAAKFNRYDILVALIDAGADPTIASLEEKFTALHFSARYLPRVIDLTAQQQEREEGTQKVDKKSSSWRAISYLLRLRGDNRINVNEPDRYGVTALHLACKRGNLKAVNMLLLRSQNIIVDIEDKNKDTPLHEACLSGHVDIVDMILQWYEQEDPQTLPARVNKQNNEDQTPLHLACREGHLVIVQNILRKILKLSERAKLCMTCDNEGSTALHLACESGNSNIVQALVLNGADIMAVKVEGISPMHIAARYGHIKVAMTLLEGDTDVNIVDENGRTPLHYAADQGQVEMINFLVKRKADISAVDEKSYTPLLLAAYEGNIPAFKALLEIGANIDDIEKDGKTVVHIVAEENHDELLKLILKNIEGLELAKSTDSLFNTPLHLASRKGNIECVEVLLRYKTAIVIDAKNELNKTPLHVAANKGHVAVVKALVDSQNDCILDEDENGNTPLHLAASNGHFQAAKTLLDYKSDVDARNSSLWTPVDIAAHKGHAKVVRLLIESGSDVNPVDKQKTTPLHLAAEKGHLEVANILLDNDADIGKDANGYTPLDIAITHDHENIAMAIIKCKKWKEALRHTYSTLEGKTTPLRRLIKKMPGVANEVFNQCSKIVEGNGSGEQQPGGKRITVDFNYEFLEDFQDRPNLFVRFMDRIKGQDTAAVEDNQSQGTSSDVSTPYKWGPHGFSKKLHPLSVMVANDRTDLLKHPLVKSLLDLKWSIYGRTAYTLNLLIYIIFVLFLTSFALVSPNPQSRTCQATSANTFREIIDGNVSFLNDSSGGCVRLSVDANTMIMDDLLSGKDVCSSEALRTLCGVEQNCGICEQNAVRRGFLGIAAAIVIAFAFIRLTFEFFQALSLGIYYIKDWVNFVEIVLFVCAIIFAVVFADPCLCPTSWQWQIGCIAVFLAWIDFIIFIRKLPNTGIYVLMFVDIFKTFLNMVILTIFLVIAFGLAFYMAFDDPTPPFARSSFATPARSLLKTMTMTTGEFEYDSIFRQFPGGAEDGQVTSEIPFLPVSVILWIIFLVMMPILLINLLVGLAVDDVKGIQNAAELRRLALQVELALSVEQLMPIFLRRRFIKHEHSIELNRKLSPYQFFRYRIFGSDDDRFDSRENIYRALHPPMAPIEQVQAQTDNLVADVKQMKEAMHDLVARNLAMEALIREMLMKSTSRQADESGTAATADNVVSQI